MKDLIPGFRVMAIFAFVVGVVCMVIGFFLSRGEAKLSANGVHVTGSVLYRDFRQDRDTDGQLSTFYRLNVKYLPNLRARDFGVPFDIYNNHPYGSTIDVVYDPRDPSDAMLARDLTGLTPSRSAFLFGGGLWLISLILLIASMRAAKEARDDTPDLDEAIERAQHPGIG